MDETLAPHFDP